MAFKFYFFITVSHWLKEPLDNPDLAVMFSGVQLDPTAFMVKDLEKMFLGLKISTSRLVRDYVTFVK